MLKNFSFFVRKNGIGTEVLPLAPKNLPFVCLVVRLLKQAFGLLKQEQPLSVFLSSPPSFFHCHQHPQSDNGAVSPPQLEYGMCETWVACVMRGELSLSSKPRLTSSSSS